MFIVSCKQTEGPKEPVVTISIVEDTVLDYYYIDEFNITTISIEVNTDGSKEIISLTPLLIENYPSEQKAVLVYLDQNRKYFENF